MVVDNVRSGQSNVLLLTSASSLAMDTAAVRQAVARLAELDVASEGSSRSRSSGEETPRAHSIHVMTSAIDALPRRRITSTLYDAVVVVPEPVGNLGFEPTAPAAFDGLVRSAAKLVKPGGRLMVIPGEESGEHASSREDQSARMKSTLVMLGFRGVDVRDGVVHGERMATKTADRISVVKLNTNGEEQVTGASGQVGRPAVWKLGADDDEDDDLIDEEELLGEDAQNGANDVRTGERIEADKGASCGATKKACANCTCGRAEGKVTKLTKEMIENPQSGGCGSCALGDAFRCAGCPYRGLPAFKVGEKISLPNDFLTDDLE